MKKFLFSIELVVVALIIVGAFWNLEKQKEHAFDYYQKELAKRDKKMRQMEDSIRHLGARVEIYEITFDALREVDSATVDRVFYTIWNVREE
jgi:uncharacterized protein YxeA